MEQMVNKDDDELFLLSLIPQMKRLNFQRKGEFRIKVQQLLHEMEFGSSSFHTQPYHPPQACHTFVNDFSPQNYSL